MSDKNWPGLGFCPAPGDLPAIAKMYADVDAVARELEELRHTLADLGSDGSAWQGEAARNFAGKLGELPKYLAQGHDSMAACSRALKAWHTQLTGLLANGRTMEAQAVELRSRLGDMNVQCDAAGKALDASAQSTDAAAQSKAKADFEAKLQAQQQLAHQLDEVVANGHKQLADHKNKAEAAAKAIMEASRHHPPDPSFLKKMLDKVEHAWQKSVDFLVEHADDLSKISAALAIAALVVPGIGPVLGAAAVLTSAAAMAGHWVGKNRGMDISWAKIGLDGLGVIPGWGAIKGFATAGKSITKVQGVGVVNKVIKAPIRNLKTSVAAEGAGAAERTSAAGAGLLEKTANPISTNAIVGGLKKAGIEVDPRVVTITNKAGGIANGFYQDEQKEKARESRIEAPGPLPKPLYRPASAPFLNAVG
ncbi:hypothetical protein DR950_31260 [Kitasatospora xanthocidica]|uniref:WXG100 family type VII secretion target n=1 Tax=Kitasatospora xanthocidica TaxID=83382 RepID=A0A373A2H8_9ACTN|nr:hypothetical protein [Kitasatospora xanthocidica]RGD61635.1 hypothetical protein DR950_31260 [Kitasatospora xanthocidica]